MTTVPAHAARPISELATAAGLRNLPDRDLDETELMRLAASVAASPQLWRDLVDFDDEERHYASLHRDAHVDVWMLCWTPRNDTGWHDHDISSGAVAVVAGRLQEHRLALGVDRAVTDVISGHVFSFGPDHIHRLTGAGAAGEQSISIHTYSPPLWRLGQYAVGAGGVLHRTSVSYADELRPLSAVPSPS
jgi:hypothetical protein